jgi:hypothetical protein
MSVTGMRFLLAVEFLGGRHNAANFTEQPEQNRLQIAKRKFIGRLNLTHVVGKEYGAVGRVQTDYLFA